MSMFFFDITDRGDVYHDARGTALPSFGAAKEKALEIARKLGSRDDDLVTVRDVTGRRLMRVKIEAGKHIAIPN
jgi:hypothetical protein